MQVSVAIIGCGYWGKNLIRVFSQLPEVRIKYIADKDPRTLSTLVQLPPATRKTSDLRKIWNDKTVKAVLIATPTLTHYRLARQALLCGKHIWIEKPLASSYQEALKLIRLAKEQNRLLHVDHTFLYSGAVEKLKEIISGKEFGQLRYVDSERINLGLIQPDVNVIWDLAVHDLSILRHVFREKMTAVQAFGSSFLTGKRGRSLSELAHLFVFYPGNVIAHVSVSWLSPVKIRKMIFGGSKQMVVYDDIHPVEKIKIYNHKVNFDITKETPITPTYRLGDVVVPQIDNTEALLKEARHFLDCLKKLKPTLTPGEDGAEVVRLLEAANESLNNGSKFVRL